MADANKTVSILLRLIDRVTGPAKAARSALGGVEKAAQGVGRQRDALGRFSRGAGGGAAKAGRDWSALSKSAFETAHAIGGAADTVERSGRGMVNAVKTPISTFADFEAQMNRVSAVTFKGAGDPATMAKMSAAAREMGATTQFSASQAAEAMGVLATGGFRAQEQIDSLRGTLDLAAAGKVEMAEAAEISVVALRGFNLEAAEAGRVADVLTNTFTSSNTAVSDIGEALKYVAPVASAAGVEIEKVSAMVGELGNVGIRGSQAGTSIRAMLTRLQAPSDKKAKSALSYLGINPKDKAGNLKPIESILADIDKAMDKRFGVGKGKAKRAALLKAIFGEEAAAGAQALIKSAGAGDLQKLIESNMNAGGTAGKVAETMMKGATGASLEMKSALEELYLTIGESVIPEVTALTREARDLFGELAGWAKENPTLVKTVVGLAGALGATGLVLAPVIRGIGALWTVGGFALKVFSAFKATAIGTKAWTIAAGGIGGVTKALNFMKLALISNPIAAIAVGIAMAAVLIYTYWDELGPFFKSLTETIVGYVDGALEAITGKVGLIKGAIESVTGVPGATVGSTLDKVRKIQGEVAGDQAGAEGKGGLFMPLEAASTVNVSEMLAKAKEEMQAAIAVDISVDQEGKVTGVKTTAPPGVKLPKKTGRQG